MLIPGQKIEQTLAKKYSKGKIGRPPYPISTMLRVHVMQLAYNLSDPEVEDNLYEVESMRRFAKLRLCEGIPDETTILHFRHFIEANKFGKTIFGTINKHLKDKGLQLKEGTIVDATIIAAPISTKNAEGERAELAKSNPLTIAEKIEASVRAKVEHSFFYMKRVFGYEKVRNRGLAKNTNRFYMLAGLTNLVRMKRVLIA